MINARIIDTILGAIKNKEGLLGAVQIICSAKDYERIELGPVLLKDMTDLFQIMETIGIARWEDAKGQPVQIQIEEDKVVAIANLYDDEKCLNFFANNEAIEESTEEVGIEEIKDTDIEIVGE